MHIYHLSDIHIRPNRHQEYRKVFAQVYDYLRAEQGIIVITGDLMHKKGQTGASYLLAREFLKTLRAIMPVILIPGNHDITSLDQIEDILGIIDDIDVVYIRDTESFVAHGLKFLHLSLVRPLAYNLAKIQQTTKDHIVLYHGDVIRGPLRTDHVCDFRMTLLGDLHEQMIGKHGAYPGSLIQQNYGESLCHGLVKWDLETNSPSPVNFQNETVFITHDLTSQPSQPSQPRDLCIPNGVKNLFIRCIVDDTVTSSAIEIMKTRLKDWTINDLILKQNCKPRSIPEIPGELHKLYLDKCPRNADLGNSQWKIRNLEFQNVFNYHGAVNCIDFEALDPISTIIGPNAIGKSNIINIILFALFDNIYSKYTKGSVLNNSATSGFISLEFQSGPGIYQIRKIYAGGWSTQLFEIPSPGGNPRHIYGKKMETQKIIQQLIGTREAFDLLSIISNTVSDTNILYMTPAERLQLFERIFNLLHLKDMITLVRSDISQLSAKIATERTRRSVIVKQIENLGSLDKVPQNQSELLSSLVQEIQALTNQIDTLVPVPRIDIVAVICEFSNIIPQEHLDEQIENLNRQYRVVPDFRNIRNVSPDPDLLIRIDAELNSHRQAIDTLSKIPQNPGIINSIQNLQSYDSENYIIPRALVLAIIDFVQKSNTVTKELEFHTLEQKRLHQDRMRQLILQQEYQTELKNKEQYIRNIEIEKQLTILREQKKANRRRDELLDLMTVFDINREQELKNEQMGREALIVHRNELQQKYQRIEAEHRKYESISASNKFKIEQLERLNQELSGDMTPMEEKLAALVQYEKQLNQLPGKIMIERLSQTTLIANDFLRNFAQFQIQFGEKQIIIQKHNLSLTPVQLSGYERFIFNLAIKYALNRQIVAKQSQILFIDEGLDVLDAQHMDELTNILDLLLKDYKQIMLITHIEEIKNLTNSHIEIKSFGNYSQCSFHKEL